MKDLFDNYVAVKCQSDYASPETKETISPLLFLSDRPSFPFAIACMGTPRGSIESRCCLHVMSTCCPFACHRYNNDCFSYTYTPYGGRNLPLRKICPMNQ